MSRGLDLSDTVHTKLSHKIKTTEDSETIKDMEKIIK